MCKETGSLLKVAARSHYSQAFPESPAVCPEKEYFFVECVKEVSDLQMPHVAPILLPNILNIFQHPEVSQFRIFLLNCVIFGWGYYFP